VSNFKGVLGLFGLQLDAILETIFPLRTSHSRRGDSVPQIPQRLVNDLPAKALGEIGQVATLEQLPELAEKITTGAIRGRVIVDLNA